jgi:CheY-like chemotaxis protein
MEKRILLVEDNAQFREDFARALERALAAETLDVTFVEAGSLAEARARLRERAGRRADRREAARWGWAEPGA